MKCPVCGSRRFFAKNPDDDFDMYEFEWTPEKIVERAATITSDKGPEGDFDD